MSDVGTIGRLTRKHWSSLDENLRNVLSVAAGIALEEGTGVYSPQLLRAMCIEGSPLCREVEKLGVQRMSATEGDAYSGKGEKIRELNVQCSGYLFSELPRLAKSHPTRRLNTRDLYEIVLSKAQGAEARAARAANVQAPPKDIWEVILGVVWGIPKKLRAMVLIGIVAAVVIFAIWASLPEQTKTQLLERLQRDNRAGGSRSPTVFPSPTALPAASPATSAPPRDNIDQVITSVNPAPFELWTYKYGGLIELPKVVSQVSFVARQFTPVANPGRYEIVEGGVNGTVISRFSVDHRAPTSVDVRLPVPSRTLRIRFVDGSSSLISISDLKFQ